MSEKDSTVTTLDDTPPVAAQPKTKAKAVAATAESAPQAATNNDAAPETSGKMVTLVIHRSHGDGGGDAVFLAHNAFARQIPRDTPCVVPMEVAQIVADAKEVTYKRGSGGVTEVVTPRFAYSITPA